MHLSTTLATCLALGAISNVLATSLGGKTSVARRSIVDGNDAVAYAWAIDAEGKKRDIIDGDDAVAYAWAIDAED